MKLKGISSEFETTINLLAHLYYMSLDIMYMLMSVGHFVNIQTVSAETCLCWLTVQMITLSSNVDRPPTNTTQPVNWSPQSSVQRSAFTGLYRIMQRQKPVHHKFRTHADVSSSNADSINRQSLSSGHDNRFLLLHRKCLNPLTCAHAATNSSSSPDPSLSVPVMGVSPILCQPLRCKPPPLRRHVSDAEAEQIRVVGNGVSGSFTEAQSLSHLLARQHRARRKIYADSGRRQAKQASNEGVLCDKGQTIDVYIPTASSPLQVKPPSGNRKSKDKVVCDVTGNPDYADMMQHRGLLEMEHVENARPLPPRHNNNNNEMSTSSREDRPQSVSSQPRVAECPSRRRLTRDRPQTVAPHTYSCEQPRHTCSPAMSAAQRVCSVDSETAVYRMLPEPKHNREDAVRDDDASLQRYSSGRGVQRTAGKQRPRGQRHCDDVDEVERVFARNTRAVPADNSIDHTDSFSICNKYALSTTVLVVISLPVLSQSNTRACERSRSFRHFAASC